MATATQKPLRPHQGSLLIAAGLAVASFIVPLLWWITVPIQYLNTHIHELCHAIVGAVTGGEVYNIVVRQDGSGVTPILGGSLLLTASAGYCGASIVGALMIFFARTAKGARAVMVTLGGMLLFSLVFWVRGDLVGILSAIFWIGALLIGARKLNDSNSTFLIQFLGATQCLASLQSFLVLVHASVQHVDSDAQNMAAASGIPAMFWALSWFGFSVVLMGLTLRSAWRPHPSA